MENGVYLHRKYLKYSLYIIPAAVAKDEAGPPPPVAQDVVPAPVAQDEAGPHPPVAQDEAGPPVAQDVPAAVTKMKMVLLLLRKMKMVLLMLPKMWMALLLLPKTRLALLLPPSKDCPSASAVKRLPSCCRPRRSGNCPPATARDKDGPPASTQDKDGPLADTQDEDGQSPCCCPSQSWSSCRRRQKIALLLLLPKTKWPFCCRCQDKDGSPAASQDENGSPPAAAQAKGRWSSSCCPTWRQLVGFGEPCFQGRPMRYFTNGRSKIDVLSVIIFYKHSIFE